MTKLSELQSKVLETMIDDVKEMRSITFEEYLDKSYEDSAHKSRGQSYEEWFEDMGEIKKSLYENYFNGKVYVYGVNKRTLAKLQEAGYIKSIEPIRRNNEKVQLNLENCGIK